MLLHLAQKFTHAHVMKNSKEQIIFSFIILINKYDDLFTSRNKGL